MNLSYISRLKLLSSRQIALRNIFTNIKLLSANTEETTEKSKHDPTEEIIEIPKRIHRGPTDILHALEATIQKDPTAPHYKYHDDPYLIPTSNVGKRVFALAQESGRKAAHWVRQQNPELFQHKEAEPPIQAFIPKMVYNENSDVSEEDLLQVIDNVLVSDAALIYKLLKDKGVDISYETQQKLLELICFYNGEECIPEEFIEERWFRQSGKGRDRFRKTWKDGGLAEEIFISFKEPTGETYSAIIQGMVKYHQVQRAWELFEEAQQKGLQLNTDAYNAIISGAHFLKEGYTMRWEFVTNLLSMMKTSKLKPNLRTLNAVLECLSTIGNQKLTKNLVLGTLSEFKKLNIEPSLGSWYFVLITFCKDRGPRSTILYDIMRHIENKEFEIQHLADTSFFVTAMDVCCNHLRDKELAKRVNNLLHYGNNYNLIGDSQKESIYYRHYFILLSATEPIEEFIENYYRKLVPHIYIPEPLVMQEILKTIDISGSIGYIPKLWSDMTIFDHSDRENLLTLILNIMLNNLSLAEPNLIERFTVIAWDIYNKIENQDPNRIQRLSFTGEILGIIMTILLKQKDFEKASVVMEKLDKGHGTVSGLPNIKALASYIDSCIENKAPSKAIVCIKYAYDSGFSEAENFAAKLKTELTLDERYLDTLTSIFGDFTQQTAKVES